MSAGLNMFYHSVAILLIRKRTCLHIGRAEHVLPFGGDPVDPEARLARETQVEGTRAQRNTT